MRPTPHPRLAVALMVLAVVVGACTSSTTSSSDDEGVSIEEPPTTEPNGIASATSDPSASPGETTPTASGDPEEGENDGAEAGPATTSPTPTSSEPRATDPDPEPRDSEPTAEPKRPAAPGTDGIDGETIEIGFEYTEGNASTQRAAGFEGLAPAPAEELHAIMGEYINSTGGIAGRELVQVFHVYDAQGRDVSVQEQEACARFTQDEKVFAVNAINSVGPGFHTDNYRACITDTGTGLFSGAVVSVVDDRAYQEFDGYIEPNAMSLTGVVTTGVRGLHEQGFFEGGTLGVIALDRPRFHHVIDEFMRPRLRAIGSKIEEISYISVPENEGDLGRTASQLSNTALRFRQAGVDRVMIVESGGGGTLLFTNAAESQGYRPRYGLTSVNGPHVISSNVPDGQFDDAQVVGWLSNSDVHPDHFPGSWRTRDRCLRIYEDAGYASFDNPAAASGALAICAGYLFLRQSLDAGSGPIDQHSVAEGALALRDHYQSAVSHWTSFSSDKRYGVARYRHGEFAADCDCFRYTSDPFPIAR